MAELKKGGPIVCGVCMANDAEWTATTTMPDGKKLVYGLCGRCWNYSQMKCGDEGAIVIARMAQNNGMTTEAEEEKK